MTLSLTPTGANTNNSPQSSKAKKDSRKDKRAKERKERKEKKAAASLDDRLHCAYCNVTAGNSAESQVRDRPQFKGA